MICASESRRMRRMKPTSATTLARTAGQANQLPPSSLQAGLCRRSRFRELPSAAGATARAAGTGSRRRYDTAGCQTCRWFLASARHKDRNRTQQMEWIAAVGTPLPLPGPAVRSPNVPCDSRARWVGRPARAIHPGCSRSETASDRVRRDSSPCRRFASDQTNRHSGSTKAFPQ